MAIAARIRDSGNHQGLHSEEISTPARHCLPCGACSCCSDTCGELECLHCESKSIDPELKSCSICKGGKTSYYTMCQIRRHNSERSAWLVAGDDIYDATVYIHSHPGGKQSILRKAGGRCDCAEDFSFHSAEGRKMWRKCFVGKVRMCPSQATSPAGRHWWMFWM
jgi:Cytochrome b5-like Heme/Steroid binding domain